MSQIFNPLDLTAPITFDVTRTVASAAGAVLDDLKVAADTTTVTGTTQITTTAGFNKVGIYKPTITDASAVTIDNAATVYIDNAPLAAGSATITSPWALRTGAGQVSFNSANEQGAFVDAFGTTRNPSVVVYRNITSSASTRNEGLLIDETYNNSTAAGSAYGMITNMYVPAANATNHNLIGSWNTQNVIDGTGTITTQVALTAAAFNRSTATVSNQNVMSLTNVNSGAGTVTTAKSISISQPIGATTGLTAVWTTLLGIDINNQNPSGAGTNTLTNPPKAIRIQSQTATGAFAISQEGSGLNNFAGVSTFSNTTDATSTTTGGAVVSGGLGVAKAAVVGSISAGSPITKTADFTVAATENVLICNKASSLTITLPTASSYPGRQLWVKTIQAQTVVSNASNVVPNTTASAGTAILPATDGAWALLVSDGTNWITMASSTLS